MQKIDNLTSLRFIAAWSIVFYHMQGGIIPINSMPQFALGVSFFFVLSGFILSVVYKDLTVSEVPRFYVNRIARVWPVHVFTMCAVMFLFDPFAILSDFWRPIILINTLLLHAWIPQSGYVFSMNPVSWSISTELAFYLLFPILVISRKIGWGVAIIAAFVFAILLKIDLSGMEVVTSSPWTTSLEVFILQNPLVRMLEFSIGILFGGFFVRKPSFLNRGGTFAEILVVICLLAFALTSGTVSSWIRSGGYNAISTWYGQSGGALIFALLIYCFALEKGALSGFLKKRVFVFLGEISFCTYMVHYPIILYSQKSNWMGQAPWLAVAGLVIASTLVVSWIVWYSVESPARHVIVKWFSVCLVRLKSVIRRAPGF